VTFCLERLAGPDVLEQSRFDLPADADEVARMSEPAPDSADPALSIPRVARVIEDALLHFHGERYALHAWCVMPDHVHVLVTPFQDRTLDTILHSWKSFTANEVNKMLHRAGALWQPESFDHLVRSPEAFDKFAAYIESNPVTAGLCSDPSSWQFSSARHRCGAGL
jgi:REP element-mobilizing transposase RayT